MPQKGGGAGLQTYPQKCSFFNRRLSLVDFDCPDSVEQHLGTKANNATLLQQRIMRNRCQAQIPQFM